MELTIFVQVLTDFQKISSIKFEIIAIQRNSTGQIYAHPVGLGLNSIVAANLSWKKLCNPIRTATKKILPGT